MTNRYHLRMFALCFLLAPYITPESETFIRFCASPSFRGKGALENNAFCTVDYPKKSDNNLKAEEFCAKASPYTFVEAVPGKSTRCVFVREYVCEDYEEDLYDNCFIVKRLNQGSFSPNACPKEYSLHVISGRMELQWIYVLFKKYPRVWVGNKGNSALVLKPKVRKRTRKGDKNSENSEGPIFVQLAKGSFNGPRRGEAFFGNPKDEVPYYLCSRKAEAFQETFAEAGENLEVLGFESGSFTGKNGESLYVVNFGNLHAVEAKRYEANFKELHSTCRILQNGFVAARDDFKDMDSFHKALELAHNMLPRASVGRASSYTMDANKDCKKEQFIEQSKKQWSYYDEQAHALEVKKDHWCDKFPDNMCADTPRITAVMYKQGYIDMPAMARRPVLCASGGSAERGKPPPRREEVCNRAAHFNKEKNRCECNDPNSDGKVMKPALYGHYPPGTVCLSCDSTVEGRSIVFIIDGSGSVGDRGWEKQIDFMSQLVDKIKDVRTGIVKMVDHPHVSLVMAKHSEQELRDWIIANWIFERSLTAMGRAIFLARGLLIMLHFASNNFLSEKRKIMSVIF
ncbi:hypothetical protein RB195_003281 [Necator americanus]|uniref:VWFA domain-containing protein n=1 Tax=Necator americanus TaxID=51031 RepID=A0ABR1DMU3_NECAM